MKTLVVALSLLGAIMCQALETKDFRPAFKYDGVPFAEGRWTVAPAAGQGGDAVVFTSPDGRARLKLEYRRWPGYPVWEVLPRLECATDQPTGIFDGFDTIRLDLPCQQESVRVRRISGSKTQLTDFMRHDVQLQPRFGLNELHLTTNEGVSASAWIPYIGVDFDETSGLELAIGWTGAWRADFQRLPNRNTVISAGLEEAHFRLLPGESYRLPSMLIYERRNQTLEEGLVAFHRFILQHKSPRDSQGRPFRPILPATASGGNKTDGNMLKVISAIQRHFPGIFDTFWIDANWYGPARELDQKTNCGPDWWKYVGDWRINTWSHPEGNLRRVSDAAAAAGMQLLLWFEPERACDGTSGIVEHPDFYHHAKENPNPSQNLLDLGNPAARQWILGVIEGHLRDSKVAIYRQDFNFGGAERRIWAGMDAPDRVGIAQIRHINGLWTLWEELRRRHPDMLLENCASGGRRMDYVMMSMAYSYCRDDAHMKRNCDELTQNITLNTTPYLPITAGETFTVPVFDDYAFFSRMGASTVFTPSDFQGMFLEREPSPEEIGWFRRVFTHAKRAGDCFFGDFYALTEPGDGGSDRYCAYQLNLPGGAGGLFAVFRREKCPQPQFLLQLRGIDPEATYRLEGADGTVQTRTGRELQSMTLDFPAPRSFQYVFYSRLDNAGK